jgi:hypothetical protein
MRDIAGYGPSPSRASRSYREAGCTVRGMMSRMPMRVGLSGNIQTDENGRMLTVREDRPRLIGDLSPDTQCAP